MLRRLVVAALLAPTAVSAQQNPFVGNWRGLTKLNGRPLTFNLVMGPDMRYSQQLISGEYMTTQSGPYGVSGQVVSFDVYDWEPKTQQVYKPYWGSTRGGYYVYEPTARPPGGSSRYRFNSPGSVTLQDVRSGASITFNRLQ